MKRFFQQHYPKYLALIITLILLGGGIFYFYAVNVEDNKKELNRKAFRTIDRIITNAYDKLEAYKVNNRFVLNKELKKICDEDSCWDKLEQSDSLLKANTENISRKLKRFGITIELITTNKDISIEEVEASLEPEFSLVKDTFSIEKIIPSKEGTDTAENNKKSLIYYFFSVDFEKFIKPLIHRDFLQEYIVFYYDKNDSFPKLKERYSTFSNRIDIKPLLVNSKKDGLENLIIKESSLNEYNISGIKYQGFLQPIGIKNNKHFLICGLMRAQNYQSLAQDINLSLVLIVVGLILIAVLLIPIFNIVLSNVARPVHYSDLVFTVISFMGITSLATLFLSGGFGFGLIATNDRRDNLVHLSQNLEEQFVKDFRVGLDVLNMFDEKLSETPFVSMYDSMKVFYDTALDESGYTLDSLKKITPTIFAISVGGKVYHQVADPSKNNFTDLSVAKRAYFYKVKQGKGWGFEQENNCYLQSIHGYTSGTSQAILSKKRSKEGVIASELNLYSLKNTCLPVGKGFAVIDESGQVLFHSDTIYNAYENFLKECDSNFHITSSIFSRHSEFFRAFYHNKDHLFYIHPIENLPLYLVTFEEDTMHKAAHVEIITFVISNFLILWVGVVLIFLVVLFMSRLKAMRVKSFILKKQSLFPDQSNRKSYPFIIAGLSAIILYQFIFLWMFPDLLGLNPPSRLILSFYSVFLGETILLVFLYWKAESAPRRRWKLLLFFSFVWLILIVGGYQLIYWAVIDAHNFTFSVLGLIAFTCLFIFLSKYFSIKNLKFLLQYKLILLLFTLLSSINPSFLFFNLSYQQEYDILNKYRELQILKNWMTIKRQLGSPKPWPSGSAIVFNYRDNQEKFFYVFPPFKMVAISKILESPDFVENKEAYFNWLSRLRLPLNNYAKQSSKLTSLHEGLDFWYWNKQLMKLQLNTQLTQKNNLSIVSETKSYSAKLADFFYQKMEAGVFFILILIVLALVLWKLIDRFIDTFTNFSPLLNKAIHRGYTSQIRKNIKGNHFQVIISPPGSGALELYLALKQEASKQGLEWIDIKEELNQTQTEKEFVLENLPENMHVLITNFSYDLYNPESNLFKLDLLERLQTISTRSITLLTHTYSLKYFILPEDKPALRHKWKLLHENFLKVYVPLSKSMMKKKIREDKNCKELLNKELSYGKSLNALIDESKREQFLLRIKLKCHKKKDDCIKYDYRCSDKLLYELRNRAGLYYQTLWESLTIDEQQLLYDLAEDGLVNIGNKLVIHRLLMKGILKLENKRLMIFNKSFHSYILSEVDKTPVLAYTLQASSSKWQHFKMPFIVSLIVLFFFIMISQNIEFKHVIPALTALATALPALFNLSPSAAKASEKVVEKVFDAQ